MYRWAPGNRTRIQTEPAPSEMLKATGILPQAREEQTRHPSDKLPWACWQVGGPRLPLFV